MTYGQAHAQLAANRTRPEWLADSTIVPESDFEHPTKKALDAAGSLLLLAEANGMAGPYRLVVDGLGGLRVEWRAHGRTWHMQVWDDGTMMPSSGELPLGKAGGRV